jgi:VanZ family protein
LPRTSDWKSASHAQPGPPPYAAPGWALIALFIIYGSVGSFSGAGASRWGPLYVSIPDVLQNVLLYFPFGCFGALALDDRRHSFAWRAAEITALACGLSLVAESAQLFIINRTASITDMAAGTLGAWLGAVSSPAVARMADAGFERARRLGITGSPFAVPLVVTLTALVAVAWWPYDITLDPGTVSTRVSVFRADPWQSGSTIELGSHFLRYALSTLLIAASLEHLRPANAAVIATLSGVLLAIVVDAGQMIMGGRPAGLAHLAFQAAGCLVGGALFAFCRKAKRHPPA